MFKNSKKHNDLLVRVAWYYHKLGLTQQEVGDKLKLSRSKVQRLLEEAREEGIIQVEIEGSLCNLLSLEGELVKKRSLEDAMVIPSVPSEGDGLRDSLGQAAATYAERLISSSEVEVMGTGWGKTLRAFADHFQPGDPRENIDVVSLVGNLLKDTAVNPFAIANTVARKLSGNCYNIWAPTIVMDEERAEIFRSEPWIKKALKKAESANVIIVSIGQMSEKSTLVQLGYISQKNLEQLKTKGAVGDILSSFFDKDGKLVDSEIHERLIALTIDKIREKKVVAVAGGLKKADAIKGALEGDLVDVLVTDENVAQKLVS